MATLKLRMSLGKRVCGCRASLYSNNIIEVDLCEKHLTRNTVTLVGQGEVEPK